MKPTLLLRIASGLMIFHAVGHSIGMSTWKKAVNAEQQAVVSGMTDHSFPFMGAVHSYGDSFQGFGLAATISMLLIAWLLWITGPFCSTQPKMGKKILLPLFLSLAALCIMEFVYFFPLAAITTLLAAISTGIAILVVKPESA